MDVKRLYETETWDWPEDADITILGTLQNNQAKESDRVLAAELAGDPTVVNDEFATALLSIIRSGDQPDKLRETAAIALGPAIEHSYINEFEDPDDILISETKFREVQQSLRRLFSDMALPKALRRRVLESSARAPEKWHTEAVRAAYAEDESWRHTAVFCMRHIRGFDDQILESLKSESPDLVYEAVRAAGDSGLDAAWPDIAAILSRKNTDKRLLLAAMEAVVNIRPEKAKEVLAPHTLSDDEDVADTAMEALAMVGAISEDEIDDEDADDDDENNGRLFH